MTNDNGELKACPLRFADKVEVLSDGCWQWTGAVQTNGYGNYQSKLAHRCSYQFHKGEIPEGLTLDHLCRNRLCVNPAHLEPVTQKVNNLRGDSPTAINKRKTHCPYGHPLSGDNIRMKYRKDGVRRECRSCERIYKRRVYQEKKNGLR